MKKFKLIPVLAVSMLLAACQAGVKVSKPKFAAEGSAMKLEDFAAEFAKTAEGYGPALKDSEFYQEKPSIGSKEMKGVESGSTVTTVTLDGKERSKSESKSAYEVATQSDATNKVIAGKMKETTEKKEKSLYGSSSSSSTEKQETTYQEGKAKYKGEENVEGVLMLNDVEKEYRLISPFVENGAITPDTWYSSLLCMEASQIVQGFLHNLPTTTDEKELAKYSYFKNDKIYTIKYSSNDEPEETKVTIDEKETVVRTRQTKVEAIYQLDVTEGKWSYKSSVETTLTVEDLADYSDYYQDYRKGLKTVTEAKAYSEAHLNDKKVSLKAKDLAKYTDVGQ